MENKEIDFRPIRKILKISELGQKFSSRNIKALTLAGFLPLCARVKILPVEMRLEVLQSTARDAIDNIVGVIDEETLKIADTVVEIMFNDLTRKPVWQDEVVDILNGET